MPAGGHCHDWYQIMLLGDKHICVQTTATNQACDLLGRKSNALTIIPPTTSHNIDNDKQKLPRGNFLVIDKAVVAAAIMSVAGE